MTSFMKQLALLAVVFLCSRAPGAEIALYVNGEQTLLAAPALVSGEDPASFTLSANQSYISQSGRPQLPFRIISVLLPASSDLTAISLETRANYSLLAGTMDVLPKPPAARRDSSGNEILIWPENTNIANGRDLDIYNTNAFWPAQQARLTGKGEMRGYKIAEVAVPLFRYNPVTRQLQALIDAEVFIDVQAPVLQTASAELTGGASDADCIERLKAMAVNFDSAADTYSTLRTMNEDVLPAPNLSDKGLVIITSNLIKKESTELANYVAHKQKSFTVNVVTQDEFGFGRGDEQAQNIRSWLQANYNNSAYGSGGILYVVIIGDPHTDDSSNVPMILSLGDRPTDYFFAELSADIDADGDGIYGEGDAGEADKYFEVYVGRIPYYGNISETDHILRKIIDYENETDKSWRRNALLPMVPLDDVTPTYQMGEQIKYYQLEPRAISSTRMYEKNYDTNPTPEYLFSGRYPATEWASDKYGMMIWQTHGSGNWAAGIIGSWETYQLNDNYPSAVFQGSCMTGEPENTDNLGWNILKNGGIGTVAASRNGLYWVGETNFTNTSSVGGIGYQYAARLAEGKTLGQAIWDSKEVLGFWDNNYYVYNLYGDPSVAVMPEASGLTATPTHGFEYNAAYGDAISSSQSYTIKNNGSSSITWSAETDADWLITSISSGSLAAGASATVSLAPSASETSLGAGTYSETITFTTSAGDVIARTSQLTIHPRSLRGYWKLDETSGDIASDSTITSQRGSVSGDFTFDTNSVDGQFGNAVELDGTDDHIEVPALNLYSNKVTISAWVKRNGAQYNLAGVVMSRDASTVAGINTTSTGELKYHWNDVVETHGWSSGLTMPDGVWALIALVIEPEQTTMYMYDGSQLYSNSQIIHNDIEEFNGSTRIGHDRHEGGRHFKGAIDDVRIYSKALSASDIAALIAGGRAEAGWPCDNQASVSRAPKLRWTPSPVAVKSDVYFGASLTALANAGTSSPEYIGSTTDYSFSAPAPLAGGADYYWRVDETDAAGNTTKGALWCFSTGDGRGTITRQVWTGLGTTIAISGLTGSANYPDNPDLEEEITKFQTPSGFGDYYGTRVYGYLVPEVSGNYTFWIAGDDEVELRLGTDSSPESASLIAYIHGTCSGLLNFDQHSTQKSAVKTLQAGNLYYIEALQKESGGDDHLAVAWEGPGFGREVISGANLMPYASYVPAPYFTQARRFSGKAVEGVQYQGDVSGWAASFGGANVSYSKLAGPLWLNVSSDGALSGVPGDGDSGEANFTIAATDEFGSATATLCVDVANRVTGERGMQDLALLSADWMQTGTSSSDVNEDGSVDEGDLKSMALSWLVEKPYGALTLYCPFEANIESGTLFGGAGIVEGNVKAPGSIDSLSLDGVNDYVEIEGFKGITGSAARTCAAWIRTTTIDGEIISWGSPETGAKWLILLDEGRLRMSCQGGFIIGSSNLADGLWHHIAIVMGDGENANAARVKLYVDGICEPVSAFSEQAINTAEGQDVTIGISPIQSTNRYFNGRIDELRIIDRALSDKEMAAMITAGIELHLPLDGASADASFYARNVLVLGEAIASAAGVEAGAMEFDGIDDYITADFKGVAGKASRSCMAWVKTSNSTRQIIADWGGDAPGELWVFRIEPDGTICVGVGGGAVYSAGIVNDGTWHHIAAVLSDDGSPSVDEVRLYIDGTAQETTASSTQSINTAAKADITIGTKLEDGSARLFFKGTMDEFMVFDKALGENEIRQMSAR
ncbi:MAG: LamG-like jellyroll fold domain-containing protein [Phycisphaerae bacterium]